MRQSQLFTKPTKETPKDEVSINAQLLIRGGFIDKLMAGVYSILPLGFLVIKKIENIIREEMIAIGGQEVFLPSLHPKANWEQTGRWETYKDLYKAKENSKEYAFGPTHEEIIAPLAKKFISSYRDIPIYLFQIQNKFRKELRAKSGLLRGREFLMKDLYSFHIDEADLDSYYQRAQKAYFNIFNRCGIGDKTYLTFASGGTFSKYSHEFQTLTPAGEDIIFICGKCRVAVNREISEDAKHVCPECGSKELREEKAVEVGNIFKLGTRFSEPFDLYVLNERGDKKSVLMGCYGIGLQRLMGTIVEIYHDENGIIWPEQVAPFKIHLIPLAPRAGLAGKDKKISGQILEKTAKIYEDLQSNKIEVLYDDREGESAGEKFADADLIGIPYRAVVSEKTIAKNCVEIKKRSEDKIELIKISETISNLKTQISKPQLKAKI